MSDRYFLDTNVLIYTFDASARRKRRIARHLVASALKDGKGVISFQVVGEFLHAAGRKFQRPLSAEDQRSYFRTVLAPLCEVQSSLDLYDRCLTVRQQTGYSFWDALILAAASLAGCKTLYTEDLQAGRHVGGVEIVDPF